ncbi:unnamed protein product, partial [Polarella glacialis]
VEDSALTTQSAEPKLNFQRTKEAMKRNSSLLLADFVGQVSRWIATATATTTTTTTCCTTPTVLRLLGGVQVAVQLTMHLPSPDLCICRAVTPMTRKQFQNSTAAISNVRVMLMQRSARGEKLCIQPPAPIIPLVPALSIGVFGSQPMGQQLTTTTTSTTQNRQRSCFLGPQLFVGGGGCKDMSRTLQQFDARRVARLSICGTSLCRKSGCGKSLQLFLLRSLMNQRLTSDVDHNEISARHHLLSSPSRAASDPSVKSCSHRVSPLFSLQRSTAMALDTTDLTEAIRLLSGSQLIRHLPERLVKMIFSSVGRFQESCPDVQLNSSSRRRLKGRTEIGEAEHLCLAPLNMAGTSCSKPPPHCRPVTGGVQRVKGSAGPGTSQGLDPLACIFRIASSSGVQVQSRLQLGPVPQGSSLAVAPCVLSQPLWKVKSTRNSRTW